MTQTIEPICRGCGESRKLVKSHIVPESFSILLNRGLKPALIVGPEEYTKKSQRGIYDSTILCECCERRLSVPDDYGQKVLIQQEQDFIPMMNGLEVVSQALPTYDYELLHRFAISVLWRASISTHIFYEKTNIGLHEEQFRKISLGIEKCDPERYGFVLGKLIHKSRGNMMLAPIIERIEGVIYWRIYVGDWHFWIKVDLGRQTPSVFRDIEAKPNTQLFALCRELICSPEHKAAKQTARRRLKQSPNDA